MIARIAEALQLADDTHSPDWRDTVDLIWLAAHMTGGEPSGAVPPPPEPVPAVVPEPRSLIERLLISVASWRRKIAKPPKAPEKRKEPEATRKRIHAAAPATDRRPAGRGSPLRTAAGPALPARLDIVRGLKPLRRRVPSRSLWEIDEDATIDQIAATGIWQPVVRRVAERWLDVALVADRSTSMAIWQSTVVELRRLLEHVGAFRSVRAWAFNADDPGHASLHRVKSNGDLSSARSGRELVDPSGRLLVLVVSDCVGPAWASGEVASLLKPLTRTSAMAIVQMLPPRLWDRTGLEPGTIWLEADRPAVPIDRLKRDARRNSRFAPAGMTIPVIRLERDSIAQWASFIAAESRALVSGRVVGRSDDEDDVDSSVPVDPAEVLRIFRRSASPAAQQLASYLSVAPLALPVMRLVQRAMLPQSTQPHLAEVFLSGMIRRLSAPDVSGERSLYDFLPPLRESLRSTVTLIDQLRVIELVSEYISREAGARNTFDAVVAGVRGDAPISQDLAQHFAELTAEALERLGPQYQAEADRLRKAASGGESEEVEEEPEPDTWDAVKAIVLQIGIDEDWAVTLSMNLPVGLFSHKVRIPSGMTAPELVVYLVGALTGSDYVQLFKVKSGRTVQLLLMADTIEPPKVHYAIASPDGIIGRAARWNRSQWLPDVEKDRDYIPAEPSTRSELALPVSRPGEPPQAVINIELETVNALDDPDRVWLREFAEALAETDLRWPEVADDGYQVSSAGIDGIDILLSQAAEAHAQEDYDGAADIYTQVLELDPSPWIYERRAAAYWYGRRYTLALRDCDTILDLAGETSGIRFIRGQILAEVGRAREAIRDLNATLKAKEGVEAYALRARAFAHAQLGHWKKADADIEQSLALEPDNAWAHYTLARMCELRKHPGKALEHYRTALSKRSPPLNRANRELALQRLQERP